MVQSGVTTHGGAMIPNPIAIGYPHGSTEAGMMRTHNPTYASYCGDGTGRDSYIILNNGGLSRSPKQGMQWPAVRKTPRDLRAMPSKKAMAFTYRSDGTGRDSYVLNNSGGLVNDFRGSKADNFFVGQLRS